MNKTWYTLVGGGETGSMYVLSQEVHWYVHINIHLVTNKTLKAVTQVARLAYIYRVWLKTSQ